MAELSKINPDWVRPSDWKYEEDWNSPAWKAKIAESDRKTREKRKKYGFMCCPKCKTRHTNKTLSCRECEYKVSSGRVTG